jgi:Arc/MetJ-type ribon-helix-helix transcriptional regulator
MATICADVTKQMIKWADEKVKKGAFKSRSEIIRELFREKMLKEDDYFLISQKALEETWKDEDDNYWKKFMK